MNLLDQELASPARKAVLTIRVLGADRKWRPHTWTAEVDASDPAAMRAEVLREAQALMASGRCGGYCLGATVAPDSAVRPRQTV